MWRDIAQPAELLDTAYSPDRVADAAMAVGVQVERAQRGRQACSKPCFLASDLGFGSRGQSPRLRIWIFVSLAALPLGSVLMSALIASKQLRPVVCRCGVLHG